MKKEVDFKSLTLKQKIAQMIIVRAEIPGTYKLVKEGIGGIFLDKQKTKQAYKKIIKQFERNSKIKLFVCTDMEGTLNPFKDFKDFKKFPDIKNKEEAYKQGLDQGKLMKGLGFNLNFSPAAEYVDKCYRGRAFCGTKKEVKEKLKGYISGLQKSVLGTCKHYPGKGMIKNLHDEMDRQKISKSDLELFEVCFKNNVKGVMIGHQIVRGEVNSSKKPSSISKEVISSLKGFKGLIISDEINMGGLRSFYLFNKRKKYRDLINAGENLILDFKLTYRGFNKLYKKLEKDVRKKKIDLKKIDESVKKILRVKGAR